MNAEIFSSREVNTPSSLEVSSPKGEKEAFSLLLTQIAKRTLASLSVAEKSKEQTPMQLMQGEVNYSPLSQRLLTLWTVQSHALAFRIVSALWAGESPARFFSSPSLYQGPIPWEPPPQYRRKKKGTKKKHKKKKESQKREGA